MNYKATEGLHENFNISHEISLELYTHPDKTGKLNVLITGMVCSSMIMLVGLRDKLNNLSITGDVHILWDVGSAIHKYMIRTYDHYPQCLLLHSLFQEKIEH